MEGEKEEIEEKEKEGVKKKKTLKRLWSSLSVRR